jgi:prepilin-type N-terminal cleavage/methylation domain-containing protein
MKNKKGFTLVELLVVIAIIGILSSVAVVNLNSARSKAKGAAAQATLSQLTTPILICLDEGKNVTNNASVTCSGTQVPTNGTALCDGGSIDTAWPTLPDGFAYNGTCNSDSAAGTWAYGANDADYTVDCTDAGCVLTAK